MIEIWLMWMRMCCSQAARFTCLLQYGGGCFGTIAAKAGRLSQVSLVKCQECLVNFQKLQKLGILGNLQKYVSISIKS